VRGRVQGIGFRAAAASEARRLRLGGWIRNRLDGAVEVTDSGGDAADARVDGEAGRDGAIADTGARDTGDDGAAATCKRACSMGCCDSNGQCQAGNAATVCGNGGNACEVCPTSPCTLSTPCCGMTSKQCGCATVGLLCNQN